MEEIKKKAHFDELNKAKEEFGDSPRKFIPVPKMRKVKKDKNKSNKK